MTHNSQSFTTADRETLREFPSIQRWLRPYKPLTHWQYLGTMLYFLDFAGPEIGAKDPESFLAWAKKADGIEVQDMLEKFAETKTRGQKLQAVSEVRSFLKRNGKMDLPVPGMTKQAPARHHRSYKRDEIREGLLAYLDQKTHKLYVLFTKDSGLRPVHVLAILYRHIKADLEAGKEYVHIDFDPPFYDGRKVAGRTFIGPETVKLLKECIDEKLIGQFEEQTKTVKDKWGREKKQKIKIWLGPPKSDTPIFSFGYPAITSALKLARKKANLDPVLQPSMGLRKFFENGLDRANMDFDKKRLIEGHSTGVRNRHYTDRDVDELRGLYSKAYRFLNLSGPGPETEETVETLNKKVGDLETQLARYKVFEAKMTVLEDELSEVRELKKLLEKKLAEK